MTFDPAKWLGVASRCAEPVANGDAEAWYRSAANRAFYASLMAIAKRVADTQGPGVLSVSNTHNQIKQALRAHRKIPVIRDLRDELQQLEEFRDKADYVLGWTCAKGWADEAVKRGDRLVSKIERLGDQYFRSLPV